MARDEEILKRRARFVSAALLLAAGCTKPKDGATAVPDSESVKQVPEPPVTPPPKVKAPPDRPTLDVKVTPAAEKRRDDALAAIDKVHRAVDKLAGEVPAACVLSESSCKARFEAFANRLMQLRDDAYALSPLHCPPKLADDKAIEGLLGNHGGWLSRWLSEIEKVAGETADAGAAWEDIRSSAAAAHPHPCLKFHCP